MACGNAAGQGRGAGRRISDRSSSFDFTGLYTNTRRLGAIVSGPLIGLGALTALGYQGVFAACAVLTVIALITTRVITRPHPGPGAAAPQSAVEAAQPSAP